MKRSFCLALLVSALVVPGLTRAQAIAGSWHLADMKQIVTDKATGQKQDISNSEEMKGMKKMIDYNCTLNVDHSLLWRGGFTGSKLMEIKGTYVLDGDRLSFDTDLAKKFGAAGNDNPLTGIPHYVTVSYSGGQMIWHFSADLTDEGKTIHTDVDWIWHRQ